MKINKNDYILFMNDDLALRIAEVDGVFGKEFDIRDVLTGDIISTIHNDQIFCKINKNQVNKTIKILKNKGIKFTIWE